MSEDLVTKISTMARHDYQKYGHRLGQSLFNALHELDPARADAIRGTDADPFYRDEAIPAFWASLAHPDPA